MKTQLNKKGEKNMWFILMGLIAIIFILSFNLSFKKHCIEDLEANVKIIQKRKNEEFIGVLIKLQDFQNFEPASRDTCTRRFINELIEKYSSENRRY